MHTFLIRLRMSSGTGAKLVSYVAMSNTAAEAVIAVKNAASKDGATIEGVGAINQTSGHYKLNPGEARKL